MPIKVNTIFDQVQPHGHICAGDGTDSLMHLLQILPNINPDLPNLPWITAGYRFAPDASLFSYCFALSKNKNIKKTGNGNSIDR